jgi:hypothetical protein
MFASVLGMVLSIEFGIANTYALGACFYVVCALMLAGSRQVNRLGLTADPAAPSIQPTQAELAANIRTAETHAVSPALQTRANEVIE